MQFTRNGACEVALHLLDVGGFRPIASPQLKSICVLRLRCGSGIMHYSREYSELLYRPCAQSPLPAFVLHLVCTKKRVKTGNEATTMQLCRDLAAGDNSCKTWNFMRYAFQLLREHSCSISGVFGKNTIAVAES